MVSPEVVLVQGEAVINTSELLEDRIVTVDEVKERLEQLERNIIGISPEDGCGKQGNHSSCRQNNSVQSAEKNNVNLYGLWIRKDFPGRHPEVGKKLAGLP